MKAGRRCQRERCRARRQAVSLPQISSAPLHSTAPFLWAASCRHLRCACTRTEAPYPHSLPKIAPSPCSSSSALSDLASTPLSLVLTRTAACAPFPPPQESTCSGSAAPGVRIMSLVLWLHTTHGLPVFLCYKICSPRLHAPTSTKIAVYTAAHREGRAQKEGTRTAVTHGQPRRPAPPEGSARPRSASVWAASEPPVLSRRAGAA